LLAIVYLELNPALAIAFGAIFATVRLFPCASASPALVARLLDYPTLACGAQAVAVSHEISATVNTSGGNSKISGIVGALQMFLRRFGKGT
jgi:hypothetical protein